MTAHEVVSKYMRSGCQTQRQDGQKQTGQDAGSGCEAECRADTTDSLNTTDDAGFAAQKHMRLRDGATTVEVVPTTTKHNGGHVVMTHYDESDAASSQGLSSLNSILEIQPPHESLGKTCYQLQPREQCQVPPQEGGVC